jgi:hypothetical protein
MAIGLAGMVPATWWSEWRVTPVGLVPEASGATSTMRSLCGVGGPPSGLETLLSRLWARGCSIEPAWRPVPRRVWANRFWRASCYDP